MARILLVDDSREILDAYQFLLESAGYEVECAVSGEEALARVKAQRPDVILADVIMPGTDGLDLVNQLRSEVPPPLPAIILWSGFEMTEEEALRRGALMFLRKPVSNDDLLALLSYALRGQRVDPSALALQRERSSAARTRARDAAADLMRRLDRNVWTKRVGNHLFWLRSYFAAGGALITVLRDEQLVVLDAGGDLTWPAGADVSDRMTYCLEVIESGSSLVLADATIHPSFAAFGRSLRGIRFFAGVPVVSREGVTFGVLCLFESKPRTFEAEDLLILEQLARRGSLLMETLAAGRPTERGWGPSPGLVSPSTFECLLDAELRLLRRQGGSIEVAVVEMDDPTRLGDVVMRQPDGRRLAGGSVGPMRGAVFKRDRGLDAAQMMDEVLQALQETSVPRGIGIASLGEPDMARLGAPEMLRIASLALEDALLSESGAHRIVLRRQDNVPAIERP
jgi:CheY-like chemotaxis protein